MESGATEPEQTLALGSLCPLKSTGEAPPHSHLNKHLETQKVPQPLFSKSLSLQLMGGEDAHARVSLVG